MEFYLLNSELKKSEVSNKVDLKPKNFEYNDFCLLEENNNKIQFERDNNFSILNSQISGFSTNDISHFKKDHNNFSSFSNLNSQNSGFSTNDITHFNKDIRNISQLHQNINNLNINYINKIDKFESILISNSNSFSFETQNNNSLISSPLLLANRTSKLIL